MWFKTKKIFDKRLWVNFSKTMTVSMGMAMVVSAAAAVVSPFGAAGIVAGAALITPFLYWFLFKRGQTYDLALETGADTFDRICNKVCGVRLDDTVAEYMQQLRPAYAHAWQANYAGAAR